ncbi:MAG TPA: Stp1/IreP family PP2C-type Ser/Thr phosphatase [Acidimicrobiia bacterium]|nr:Stp1/IreP family PP2C-type Ser/Thr phosphatase [Acidimicrobiia bacterium]
MKLAAATSTDTGLVRTNNEDYFLVDDVRAIFAVADGMGGHRGGEVASHTAIESLRSSMARGLALNDAIVEANHAVIDKASSDSELHGMGTTLTAVMPIGGNQLLIGHVGDSRAYLLHEGTLTRITDDHSLVEELVRAGRLTPEQAESHPQRAIITRALGVDVEVDVDVYTIEVVPGDRVMLCSDGLTTMIRERDVERIIRAEQEPQHAADALVRAANEAGGEDNTTVLVLDILETSATPPPDPDALLDSPPTGAAAVAAAGPEPPPPAPDAEPPPKGTKLRTLRGAILVIVPLLFIVGIATAALGYYARQSYFVGASGDTVVIYKGIPGGVLGWNPTVEENTTVLVSDLPDDLQDRVETNATRGSLNTTLAFVTQLNEATSTTTTSTSTTTTDATTSTTRRSTTTTRP